jgi:hypothetical protein
MVEGSVLIIVAVKDVLSNCTRVRRHRCPRGAAVERLDARSRLGISSVVSGKKGAASCLNTTL